MKVMQIDEAAGFAEVAQAVLEHARAKHNKGAVVVTLSGDLGAGKTTFTQHLAQALGVSETVVSPTYVVMKRYETNDEAFKELVHIDAYRIEAVDEMRVLRFAEILEQNNTIICIEWPEHIRDVLPAEVIAVAITSMNTGRSITIQ